MNITAVEVIVPAEQPALVLPAEQAYVTETPTGLVFAESTPLEVWAGLTTRLLRQRKVLEWALADAINFGEKRYGEVYSQWVEETGLTKHTLTNIAAVGRRVEMSRRRENVSFSHHAEVAYLPVDRQERLLEAAEDAGWTRYELRDAVRVDKEQAKRRAEAMVGDDAEPAHVWHPTESDLTDEARWLMEAHLPPGKSRSLCASVWISCLVATDQRGSFSRWEGPTE